ncbi:TPA: hypothetical protein ACHHA7_002778 [Staphylococcus aureus]|uniref:hypothetical protein n=1 Tax=Staphylococcus TaxID=1279 RepID=UPI00086F31B4|nr:MULTISPECIES: hypothetical protein [Staphylococcus]EGQ3127601.1 hypothetical protein [Staphylococcus pseudintermedius]SCU54042.1 Uncharacterised protein [Staphylococcus aureus]HCY0820897.1 hypothetical protein [Staphylococcus aureus]HCZ0964021.1 hypothetical protein [Staphylococcus aureus]HDE9628355.1 hypothetical protein [Staphylococcus aureus]
MKRQDRVAYSRQEKNKPISKDIIKVGIWFSSVIGFLTGIVNGINALIEFIQKHFL